MKVIVTGGRDYNERKAVFEILSEINPTLVIEGGASGADALAREWCALNKVPNKTYRANWNSHGRAAGPMRNEVMVRENKDAVLVAFPGGRGTEDCVARAKREGLKIIEPHGKKAREYLNRSKSP